MDILPATQLDWPAIHQIYREGIRSGHATFQREDEVPDGATWFAGKLPHLVFKAVRQHGATVSKEMVDGETVGWAALAPVSGRAVYQGVAEVSVYVAAAARGQNVGRMLLAHLILASEDAGLWTLQASVFPENHASIRLHQAAGFRIVGTREKLGKMNGIWRDVVLMERRSPRI